MINNSTYTNNTQNPPADGAKLLWVDLLKAIALIWIFVNHLVEELFGYPYIANPFNGWPPLSERLAQLHPITGYGFWNIPVNILRYIGWSGDQGVQLFILISGFGLTWSLLAQNGRTRLNLLQFYLRRAKRIYPLWWGVHIIYIFAWLLTGIGLSATSAATYLSFIGIRITPGLFYYFSPAWWYIGLLIQLYLVFPILWAGLKRLGPWYFLISCLAIALPIRALGLFYFSDYLDAWQRGAIFITRLPEFAFGISLAAWFFKYPKRTDRFLISPLSIYGAVILYLLGTALSLTLSGIIFAPLLLAVGTFVIFYFIFRRVANPNNNLVKPTLWIGRQSYSLYLIHHPVILLMIPNEITNILNLSVATAGSFVITVIGAIVLEQSVGFVQNSLGNRFRRTGLLKTSVFISACGIALIGILIGSEIFIRRIDPTEILGWGERPSLQPDERFGWRLKPSRDTRLRWDTYDYLVQSNSLGFPGPEYPEKKPPNTYRIMVVGDAFTSAEGVDTYEAWPRLLEDLLNGKQLTERVEILNFAITGYGPNQYQAVIDTYAPIYSPDLILVGLFVNDYQDVMWSNDEFRNSIGFSEPSQDSFYSVLRLESLRKYIRVKIIDRLKEILLGDVPPYGYFLGNFSALEINNINIQNYGKELVAERLVQLKNIADDLDMKIIITMIPAPIQVCQATDLAYYPMAVNIHDDNLYDIDLPQKMTEEITDKLQIHYYDLRIALKSSSTPCPYYATNMHWKKEGHQITANFLADILIRDGYIQ